MLFRSKVDSISGYPYKRLNSSLSDQYYVLSVKNTYTNSGVHETTVTATMLVTPINEDVPATAPTEDPKEPE